MANNHSNSKVDKISDLLTVASKDIISGPQKWIDFLETSSYLYRYSFIDTVLIHAQRPKAKAVASFEAWNRRGFWIKRGSKGIALIDETQWGYQLRYVFDVSDIQSRNQYYRIWSADSTIHSELIREMKKEFHFYSDETDMPSFIMELSHHLATESIDDLMEQLLHYVENSGLENRTEFEIKQTSFNVLKHSIAYEIMKRCDIDSRIYIDKEDFYGIEEFNTPELLGIIGNSVHDNSEMVLELISKTVRSRTLEKYTKIVDNKSEEKNQGGMEDEHQLYADRRLPVSGDDDENKGQRQIRSDASRMVKEPPAGSTVFNDDKKSAGTSSSADSKRSGGNEELTDETAPYEEPGTKQGDKPDGVGTAHEQSGPSGGGNYYSDTDTQLEFEFDIETKEGDSEITSLPPFHLDELYKLLCEDRFMKKTKEEVIHFFQNNKDENKRAEFMSSCYDETLIQIFRDPPYDHSYIGYKKIDSEMHVWEGNYLNPIAFSKLDFYFIQNEVSKLIDSGLYWIPTLPERQTGLQSAYWSKLFNRNVTIHVFSYHDKLLKSSGEMIDYFNKHEDLDERIQFVKECYDDEPMEWEVDHVPLGLMKTEDGMHIYFGSIDDQRASVDYSWNVIINEIDGLILSRYFDPKVQLPSIEEQQTAIYESKKALQNGIFFSQEEIDRVLVLGSGVSEGKYRIYHQFLKKEGSKANIEFLKKEYGVGGSSPKVGVISEFHDAKGIRLTRGREIGVDEIDITLTWKKVEKRISELITLGRYLNQKELNKYPAYINKVETNDKLDNHDNDVSDKSVHYNKEYAFHQGDMIYIGTDQYEINIEDNGYYLYNMEFPLFSKNASHEELLQFAEENPLNDHLLVNVIDLEPVNSSVGEPVNDNTYEQHNSLKSTPYPNHDDEIYRNLYVSLDKTVPNIVNQKSCLVVMQSGNESMMITRHEDEPLKVEMFYMKDMGFYEENSPLIRLEIRDHEQLLIPKYYNDHFEDVEIDQTSKEVLNDYAVKWFNEMKDKDFHIINEHYYTDETRTEHYDIDIEPYGYLRYASNMPYSKIVDYCNSNHYKLSSDFREKMEVQFLERIVNTLGIEDIEIGWDDEYQQVIAGNGDSIWSGLRFYQYLADEVFIYDDNQPVGLSLFDYEIFTDFKGLQAPLPIEKINYHIDDEHLGSGTPKEKYRNNVAAIRLLFSLEKENRLADKDEQEILAKYVGWGGLSDVFDESKTNCSNEYVELKDLLSEEEYAKARESTLSSFYTSPAVIDSIYRIIENMGFRYGNILEPSCGVGRFFGRMSESLKASKLYGIELDSISGRIAKQLYQNVNIAVDGFENTKLPDSFFDIAIGNVPFGQFKVIDSRYDHLNFNIHDYFFAKTIDKVRPGGIIAFVTSRYTMDKKNSNARKYISQRAEFLGAIRLPNNAFDDTKTVSDIIFLQKKENVSFTQSSWLSVGNDDEGNIYNQYFIDHPEMILGQIVRTTTQYGREDITVEPRENISLKDQLKHAEQFIGGTIESYLIDDDLENNETEFIPADVNVRNYSYTLMDGDIYYRVDSVMNKMHISANAKSRMIGLISIRDSVRHLIELQSEDYPESMIHEEQDRLNELYDDFILKYGLINSRSNRQTFRDDSSYYLLSSLEILNEDGTLKRKADMFSKRTIRKKTEITQVQNANDALTASLSEKGKVDLDYMSGLYNRSKEEIVGELKKVIYRLPDKMNEPEYVIADEYLSGNIREKLNTAKLATTLDDTFNENVTALEEAMPKKLKAQEIEVRLGATWIDPEIYEQFMFELLDTNFYSKRYIKIAYSDYTGIWNISGKNYDSNNVKAETAYGTHRANAYRLIEDCLNLKSTKIFDYEYDDSGKKVAILNRKETAIAQQKQDDIKEAFQNWIWKDIERREKLEEVYNEHFNSIRPREYHGDHLRFPNMNPEITLRKHQKDAVAHILYGGNTLLAHVVGSGKTYTMATACMEMNRIGLSNKAMFVVPNHLVEQWGSEFLQLYPSAKILVTTKRDFLKNNRKRLFSRIATGDYDAVIVGQTQFEKIPMSIEYQKQNIKKETEAITEGIQYIKTNNGARFTIKQLEKTKKNLKARLEKLNKNDRKDDLLTFEQLGIDRLFVDEAHYYKNLFLYTKMNNVAGIASSEAQKSSDMYMKCRYMDEITGGKGIVFATGTPISNSMTEMYTMQRYLQYNTLKKMRLEHFDSWASTFGETVSAIELAPEGSGYRMKTRFARFFNLPELIAIFKEVADIKTADMLNLPTPVAHYHNVAVKPSEQQKEIVDSLAERAEKIREGSVDPTEDNMLKITHDGRKLALDQRLADPALDDYPHSKVNACIENVLRIYQETTDKKSTQLIFCDMSTPAKTSSALFEQLNHNGDTPYSNVYDDIAIKLVQGGVPQDEIAYIHDASTDVKKKELFTKVRSGKVRILLGSTQKMGAGTNVQNLLIASHDLDCPWRPSDLEQRAGRIVRQGNTNSDVHIYRYVTEQTFDSYLYQLVENKQKFISQIMTSKSPVRTAEDIDEATLSYAEIKAMASGNPLIKEKMELDMKVSRLKMAKASYLNQKYEMENKVIYEFPQKIQYISQRILGLKEDIQSVITDEGFSPMTINNVVYTEKDKAGSAILLMCQQYKYEKSTVIGAYRGFQMELSYNSFDGYHKLFLKNKLSYMVELGNSSYGNIARIDHVIDGLERQLTQEKRLLEQTRQQFSHAKEELDKPFDKEDELNQLNKRLSKLNKELDIGNKDQAEIIDEGCEEIERTSKSMER